MTRMPPARVRARAGAREGHAPALHLAALCALLALLLIGAGACRADRSEPDRACATGTPDRPVICHTTGGGS